MSTPQSSKAWEHVVSVTSTSTEGVRTDIEMLRPPDLIVTSTTPTPSSRDANAHIPVSPTNRAPHPQPTAAVFTPSSREQQYNEGSSFKDRLAFRLAPMSKARCTEKARSCSPKLRPTASPSSFTGGKFFVPGTPDRVNTQVRHRWRDRNTGVFNERSKARLRLVRRDAPFHQSSGRIYMKRNARVLQRLAVQDPFHVCLSLRLDLLVLVCISIYTVVMLFFAGLYVVLDNPDVHCGVAPQGSWPTYYEAFAFSLETMTTIGYGIPNGGSFFDDHCVGVLIAVYFQAMIFIVLNASLVGILFSRISVANKRSSQIIFSNKATIRCVRNRFYFMFQVGEASFFDYHPIVEAHVRVYGVLHEEARAPKAMSSGDASREASENEEQAPERAFFQTRVMRLTNPNDELGGVLFLATPQVVSHRIDLWSPMYPPAARNTKTDDQHDGSAYHFPGLVFREADREVAISDEGGSIGDSPVPHHRWGSDVISHESLSPLALPHRTMAAQHDHKLHRAATTPSACCRQALPQQLPACSADCGTTPSRDDGHVPNNHSSPPLEGQRVEEDSWSMPKPKTGNNATHMELLEMRKRIKEHLANSELEVVVIVEGIDPYSSNTFQARHSYAGDDIVFDQSFASCMSLDTDGWAKLDWSRFHEMKPCPFNTSVIIGSSHS